MSMEDFKAMMDELIAEEEKRLGIGTQEFVERHEETVKRHEEIMEMKGNIRKEKTLKKQFIGAKEVAEITGSSESKAYSIIRQLNDELKDKGYVIIRGKVSRAYFEEKCYGVHITE